MQATITVKTNGSPATVEMTSLAGDKETIEVEGVEEIVFNPDNIMTITVHDAETGSA